MRHFIGIDVGTGSARAGLFNENGVMLGSAAQEFQTWTPQTDFYEQSSEGIWQAVCHAVRAAVKGSGVDPSDVVGLGFDSTCSLVVLDRDDKPVTVSPTGSDAQNVIVWMDHRAIAEAEQINHSAHPVLRYVGGIISPEMETPKLLWLKKHLPKSWARAARFFDLPDYLTYRATGDETRSLCSTVCKWTYLGHEEAPEGSGSVGRWDASYFETIGLKELVEEGFSRLGTRVRPMGEAVGEGLTEQAATDLGLLPRTAVSVSIIDAHAGGVGMVGAPLEDAPLTAETLERRLALIGGTSSCHMAVSEEPRFIYGVWGPYFSAMLPGMWLTEGGQSATGSLVDHTIRNHRAWPELMEVAEKRGTSVYEVLNERLDALAEKDDSARLTKHLHVCPYFHGNRSPRADPHLRGMISGLRLSATLDDLALLYLATIQAIAYGTRHIIETLNDHGYRIDTVLACGGGTKNPVFLREHADISGCRIVLPREPEAVLLGAAILGAAAAGESGGLMEVMQKMTAAKQVIEPRSGSIKTYHESKYRVFHRLYEDQLAYAGLMK